MSKGGPESKIPILGKNGSSGRSLSRLASLSSKVRAHLTPSSESKLRPGSGMFLGLLGQNSRSSGKSNKRPSGFYQPLQEFTHKSEGCSPEEERVCEAHIGRRVIVSGRRVGTLRYYGLKKFGDGLWAGVELDTEEGEHDGCIDGVRYFSCSSRRGILISETEVALVPQVKYVSEVSSSGPHSFIGFNSQTSTPGSPPLSSHHSGSAGSLVPRNMELPSKHSSFELDESLGILTPDQMSDFTLNCHLERSPSAEELSSFMLQDVEFSDMALDLAADKRNSMEILEKDDKMTELVPDASEISESAKNTTQTSNSARSKKESRMDRTPSLEDLPLDSAGDTSTEKTESYDVKPKPPNSFITSITSITSLDNGYQGDGEWSRPASRGPEHSPTGKNRIVKARLDPMTDSDFFTESDADMTEEWGHRRAQVIDGTLYNAQPCLAAQGQIQRFSPSNEEMDSSGIYSDLEKKPDETGWIKEEDEERPMSPEGSIRTVSSKSDQSLKKVSPTSFSTLIEQVNTIKNLMVMDVQEPEPEEEPKTGDSTSEDKSDSKKFKVPKRNAVSKIKIMISTTNGSRKDEDQENRIPSRPVKKGRWDAVMNKIAQGQAEEKTTPKLKEVKSKVFSGISGNSGVTNSGSCPKQPASSQTRPSTTGCCKRLTSTRGLSSAQSISTRSLRDLNVVKPKSRRTRIRSSESSLQGGTPCSQTSSRNSSVSDLSLAKPSTAPATRSTKKREAGVAARCPSPLSDGSTQPVVKKSPAGSASLQRAKTPQLQGKNGVSGEKTPLVRKTTPRRTGLLPSQKPQPLRDQNRGGGVGKSSLSGPQSQPGVGPETDRQQAAAPAVAAPPPLKQACLTPAPVTAPLPPPPPDPAPLRHAARGAQALAVLVHHLVFNLEAFTTPQLKKDLESIKSKWLRSQLELEELKVSYNRLQEEYLIGKSEKEKELDEIEKNHKAEVDELQDKYTEEMNKLTRSFEQSMNELQRKFEIKEERLNSDLEKRLEVVGRGKSELETEVLRLQNQLEAALGRVSRLEAELETASGREVELTTQLSEARHRYDNLKEGLSVVGGGTYRTDRDKSKRTSSCSSLQAEVDSLQVVLDLRCNELQELRRQSLVWKRDALELPSALQRLSVLTAKVEDLQAQIARREEIEKQLQEEKQILSDTLVKESTQKKRLSLQNEELQWKLKQNCLVLNAIAGISNPGTPKSVGTTQETPNNAVRTSGRRSSAKMSSSYELNKTSSEADISLSRLSSCSDKSPPGSPTVKSVIEKADSVSWVLDLEEPPECVAERILRRAASSRLLHNATSSGCSLSSSAGVAIVAGGPAGSTWGSGSRPSVPRLATSSPIKVNWEPQSDGEENIREEVIMVKGIGGNEVLELLTVDETDEIFIEDLPQGESTRGGGDESAEMLRRVGERTAPERELPKDSAGEAMISGEGSDEEEEDQEVEEEGPSGSESEPEEEETTSSGGDLSDTRLFRLNGASDSGSLNMSWAEDVDILPSEGPLDC